MLNFNDWSKKDKKTREKGYTLTKSSSGLPLFVLDNPLQKDDEKRFYMRIIEEGYSDDAPEDDGYYCLVVPFDTKQVEEV